LRIRRAISSLGEPPFKVLAVFLLAVFAVTRLPYFWYSPRVDLSLDSDAYLALADSFRGGKWPQLLYRTPGYPLFMLLVRSCVDRLVAVIFVQNLLSFLSALCLVYSVHRLWRPLALPAAIAMCGFLGSSQVLIYDISLLTESLYTSTVILVVAFLFLGFALDRAAFLSLASALMAWAIVVRPAGAYLAVIYALVLGFLLWNRFSLRAVLGFIAPFPALLLGLCAYNQATAGQFVITGAAESNLAGATLLFWEPDPRLPERVNKALVRLPDSYGKMGITQQELKLVRTSWDPGPLFDVYTKAYNRLVWSSGFGTGHQFGGGDYIQNRKLVRDASIIAIRRHPDLYAKYVWVNLVMFFEGVGYKFDFQSSLEYRATGPIPSEVRAADLARAEAPPVRPPQAVARRGEGADVPAVERGVKRLQLGWQSLHGVIFQSVVWAWAYFAVTALSLVQLVRSGGHHRGAFLLVVLALIPIGAGLVVCLVEEALDRYSYPTQFVYYVAVALSPLLWHAGALGGPSVKSSNQGSAGGQAQP
jgi:hypothetical protein